MDGADWVVRGTLAEDEAYEWGGDSIEVVDDQLVLRTTVPAGCDNIDAEVSVPVGVVAQVLSNAGSLPSEVVGLRAETAALKARVEALETYINYGYSYAVRRRKNGLWLISRHGCLWSTDRGKRVEFVSRVEAMARFDGCEKDVALVRIRRKSRSMVLLSGLLL